MNEIIANQSENINELLMALSKAQGELRPASKGKNNPFFKTAYADLTSVWQACREPLANHGLSVVQLVQAFECESGFAMMTMIGHSSGQWIKSVCPMILDKKNAQGMGSAISYYRRYIMSSMLGIVTEDEDDDGNEASKYEEPKKQISKTLTENDISQINLLLDRIPDGESTLKKILDRFSVRDLSQIQKESFEKIILWINEKIQKQEKVVNIEQAN